jgi:hypothetical protein
VSPRTGDAVLRVLAGAPNLALELGEVEAGGGQHLQRGLDGLQLRWADEHGRGHSVAGDHHTFVRTVDRRAIHLELDARGICRSRPVHC